MYREKTKLWKLSVNEHLLRIHRRLVSNSDKFLTEQTCVFTRCLQMLSNSIDNGF